MIAWDPAEQSDGDNRITRIEFIGGQGDIELVKIPGGLRDLRSFVGCHE